MSNFLEIKEILDNAVGGAAAPVAGPHRAFWRTQTRDQFVNFRILGLPIIMLGNGSGSTIVKALRGEAPFGQISVRPVPPSGGCQPDLLQ